MSFTLKSNIRGFTLTELVVVLALVGIAALLAWPMMTGSLEELYLRQTANQLVRDIRFVQQQTMNNPSGGWKISFVTSQVINGQDTNVQGWSIHCFENQFSQVQRTYQLPPGLTYIGMNFDKPEIRFSELGVPVSAGRVGICDRAGHKLYIILASVTGKVRIDTQPP